MLEAKTIEELTITLIITNKATLETSSIKLPISQTKLAQFEQDGYRIDDWDSVLEIANQLSLREFNELAVFLQNNNIDTLQNAYDYLSATDNLGYELPEMQDFTDYDVLDNAFSGLKPHEILKNAGSINMADEVVVKDQSTGEVWTLATKDDFLNYYNDVIAEKLINLATSASV